MGLGSSDARFFGRIDEDMMVKSKMKIRDLTDAMCTTKFHLFIENFTTIRLHKDRTVDSEPHVCIALNYQQTRCGRQRHVGFSCGMLSHPRNLVMSWNWRVFKKPSNVGKMSVPSKAD